MNQNRRTNQNRMANRNGKRTMERRPARSAADGWERGGARRTDGGMPRPERRYRESYGLRMARLMARMARDAETEELAELITGLVEPEAAPATAAWPEDLGEEIAETVEEMLEEVPDAADEEAEEAPDDPAGNAPAAEAAPDCGAEMMAMLRQILALLQPAADCGGANSGGEPARDEESETAQAEGENGGALAEAVAEAVIAAAAPAETADPVDAMVEEVISAVASQEEASPAESIGETLGEVIGETMETVLAEPEDGEAGVISVNQDAMRAAMASFRPILRTMKPAERQRTVRRIADSLRRQPRRQTGDAYARLKGGTRRDPTKADAELGRRIMEKRNANYR